MRWLRILWLTLIAGSIVFAAGISGTWLNAQMPEGLAHWRWGWLGATLAGLTVFGGVFLAQREQKIGWAVAATGALVDILIDVQFFLVSHDLVMSAALGIFPMLIAVLAGVVEGRNLAIDSSYNLSMEERQLNWELKQKEKTANHERRLELLRAKAEMNGYSPIRSMKQQNETTEQKMEKRIERLETFLQREPEASYTTIERETGIPRATAYRWINLRGWKKNGAGWEKERIEATQ